MGLRDAVIAGYAETKITQRSGSDPYALAGDIVNSLLVRTGFEKAEVDGLIMSPSLTAARTTFWAQCVAEFLGLELRYCDTTDLGGCSPTAGVARRLRVGTVRLNGASDPGAPFGGFKQSGIGREHGRYGLEEFVEWQAIVG